MKAIRIALAALAVAILSCGGVRGAQDEAPGWPDARDPHAVLAAYLAAVDRGELTVFDRALDRSMIVPRRVEYLYSLDDHSLAVRVYADLREPLPVPGAVGCEVRALASILDPAGRIVHTEVHIWQRPGVQARAPARSAQCPATEQTRRSRNEVPG